MKLFCVSAVFALVIGSQSGPDLSGRWNREPAGTSAGEESAGWGPRVEIAQTGVNVSVKPTPGKPSQFRTDGKEYAEVISVNGCANTVRITKAASSRDKITITTWLVMKSVCVHGEDEDDPLVTHIGVVDVQKVFGRRKLESITDVYREGDTLTVETTRSSPGGETTNTTTTYRR